mmetsp:Transcript_14963/g.22036  ORF Transcript_14963/g.22036 Transcript_14963/m.22036 type:complete len:176 (-) Transcript_14963:69-596(-)|eukprot:CAMPEP_0194217642 /NCGR_PEP_ID=MMETSP0156-20130528/21878_1 /TAXON_ID=33649 /ORGANISM="Thalassionema nitzschioides, Strain L26-B" /LENGTH=175 /DNA_ID=CAMNT_0038946743 /DNA_START=106 /DNA_END=633 /DNA_ORIENTATION=+
MAISALVDGSNNRSTANYTSHLEESQIERLLELGADPNTVVAGWTPLTYAAMFSHFKVAQLLLEKGADPNLQTEEIIRKITPLHMASCGKIVSLLLGRGADPEITMENGSTPLHSAIISGNEEVVSTLLTNQIIQSSLNDNCQTAMSLARQGGIERRNILQQLMKAKLQKIYLAY